MAHREKKLDCHVFDKLVAKNVHILQVVLSSMDEENLLPELYEIFGREALLKFLDIFGGVTIRVPKRDIVRSAVEKVKVWIVLENKLATVAQLSEEMGKSEAHIRRLYSMAKKELNRYKPYL